jgi:tetratricopeptide (TPR) repeat protein
MLSRIYLLLIAFWFGFITIHESTSDIQDKFALASNLNRLGLSKYNESRYVDAIQLFAEAIRIVPFEKAYYLNKARAHFKLTEYEETLRALFSALVIDVSYKDALNLKASTLYVLALNHSRNEKYESALKAINGAIHISDKNYEFLMLKASVLNQLNRSNEAVKMAIIAYTLKDKTGEVSEALTNFGAYLNEIGDYYFHLGNYATAMRFYNQSIELNENEKVFYYEKARTVYLLNDYNAALALLDQAIKLDSNYTDSLYLKAHVLYKQALVNFESANLNTSLRLVNKALELTHSGEYEMFKLGIFRNLNLELSWVDAKPESNRTHTDAQVADFYNQLGMNNSNRLAATKYFDTAILMLPANLTFYKNKALCLFNLRHYVESIDTLNISLARANQTEEKAFFHELLSRNYFRLGDFNTSLAHIEWALRLRANNDTLIRKAYVLYELGAYNESIEILKPFLVSELNNISIAIEIDAAKFANILYLISKDYFKLGNLTISSNFMEKAIFLQPINKHFLLFKAELEFKMENYDKCVELANHVLKIEANSTDALLIKAHSFNAIGEQKKRAKMYDEAIHFVEEAIKLHAERKFYVNKVEILYAMERYKEAVEISKKALKMDTSHSRV